MALTNVAGAIQWFNGDSSNLNREPYTRTLTDGTVGIADHEDAHTVTVALTGFFFEKTVADLTSGANPAVTAAPGDTLRYTLRFRSTDESLANFRIYDELDALNPQAMFVSGSLALVTYPAGADVSNTNPIGGANGSGVIDIRNLSVPVSGEILIQFDVTLAASLDNGTVVTNQSALRLSNGSTFTVSDDPNVNGVANPEVAGDEDPTRVTIASSAFFVVQKISTDLTGDPAILLAGETLRYTITVRNVGNGDAIDTSLRDAVPVNTTYVAGSTDAEWHRDGRCRRRFAARERHADLLAGRPDAGVDAGRPLRQPGERRDHHIRRRRGSKRHPGHDRLQPGLRDGAEQQHRRLPLGQPGHDHCERPDAATSSARCRCSTPKSGRYCSAIWDRPASSIRAMCSATRSRCRTRRCPGDRHRADRLGSGQYGLRGEHHAAQWAARRTAGRRRVAARRRHLRQFLRPDAAAAGRGRRHRLARCDSSPPVRPASR